MKAIAKKNRRWQVIKKEKKRGNQKIIEKEVRLFRTDQSTTTNKPTPKQQANNKTEQQKAKKQIKCEGKRGKNIRPDLQHIVLLSAV